MAVPIPPVSTAYPEAPQRNEPEAAFIQKSNAFVSALDPRRIELQALADYTYARAAEVQTLQASAAQSDRNARLFADSSEQYADDARAASQLAEGLASFIGKWADASGAVSVPTSVYHAGQYWALTSDLADASLAEPGKDSRWAPAGLINDTRTSSTEGWSSRKITDAISKSKRNQTMMSLLFS